MITLNCDLCLKPFQTHAAWAKKRKNHYCSRECKDAHHGVLYGRENHHQWKGRRSNQRGYILINDPKHANSDKQGYVLEHVAVMSKHINRPLLPGEVVHHVNRNTSDNRIENLRLMSFIEHNKLHSHDKKTRRKPLKQKPIAMCESCGTEFTVNYKGKRYCSLKCFGVSMKLQSKNCVICNTNFIPSLTTISTCSVSCGRKLGHLSRLKDAD